MEGGGRKGEERRGEEGIQSPPIKLNDVQRSRSNLH
jgi:hypothetical protein